MPRACSSPLVTRLQHAAIVARARGDVRTANLLEEAVARLLPPPPSALRRFYAWCVRVLSSAILMVACFGSIGCGPARSGHAFDDSAPTPMPTLTERRAVAGPSYNFVGDWSEADKATVLESFGEWPRSITYALDLYHVTPTQTFADQCPDSHPASGGTYLGYTFEGSRMCIYTAIPELLAKVAAHEYGHALGLGHYEGTEPSIMFADIDDAADTVQPEDVAALASSR